MKLNISLQLILKVLEQYLMVQDNTQNKQFNEKDRLQQCTIVFIYIFKNLRYTCTHKCIKVFKISNSDLFHLFIK